jgi:hypothetical protein
VTAAWLAAVWLSTQVAPQPPANSNRPSIDGQISLLADAVPREAALELRPQVRLDLSGRRGDRLRYRFEALFEALAADRSGSVTDAIARVREGWIEIGGDGGDVRIGYGRIVWGRLDEIQPSDVINPLNITRFLFDGRSEARLPVSFVRGRWNLSEHLMLEGIVVPVFRRGWFDELDEPTSPFNLVNDVVLPPAFVLSDPVVHHQEPAASWSNLSGGGRVSATAGRVDVAAAVYRGFDSFGIVRFEPDAPIALSATSGPAPSGVEGPGPSAVEGRLVERFPRFTMISGDFETVVGEWAIRGELAAFVDKQFPRTDRPGSVEGAAIDGGVGVDRRAGDYRVFGSVLLRRDWSAEDPGVASTNVNLVASIDRTFSRDRCLARVFTVVNPGDASGFVRGLVVWTARDNVAIEGTAGAFLGTGDDSLSRFQNRDFLFARVRYVF